MTDSIVVTQNTESYVIVSTLAEDGLKFSHGTTIKCVSETALILIDGFIADEYKTRFPVLADEADDRIRIVFSLESLGKQKAYSIIATTEQGAETVHDVYYVCQNEIKIPEKDEPAIFCFKDVSGKVHKLTVDNIIKDDMQLNISGAKFDIPSQIWAEDHDQIVLLSFQWRHNAFGRAPHAEFKGHMSSPHNP